MTATLVAKDLSGGHGHRILFEGLDLTVAPGDVIGVVGANGAGKSTLLSLLGGAVRPMAGTVSCAPRDAFVGLLPQERERVPGETVRHYIGASGPTSRPRSASTGATRSSRSAAPLAIQRSKAIA